MLGSLVLAGIGCALMSNPRRKRKVRRNPKARRAKWKNRQRNPVDPYKYEPIRVDVASESLLRDTLWGILLGVPSRSYTALKEVAPHVKQQAKRRVAAMPLSQVRDAIAAFQATRSNPRQKRRNPDVWARVAAQVARQKAAGTGGPKPTGYSSTAAMPNPRRKGKRKVRRSRISVSQAAARMMQWRWHHNPGGSDLVPWIVETTEMRGFSHGKPNIRTEKSAFRGKSHTAKALAAWVLRYNQSFTSGGVNSHASKAFGYEPYAFKAKLINQRNGRVAATYSAPKFQVL